MHAVWPIASEWPLRWAAEAPQRRRAALSLEGRLAFPARCPLAPFLCLYPLSPPISRGYPSLYPQLGWQVLITPAWLCKPP
jgi:hypothetical protein